MPLSIAHHTTSKTGGHGENEDRYLTFERPGGEFVFAVADGLGGHVSGAEAAELAVKTVRELAEDPNFVFADNLHEVFERAHANVVQHQRNSTSADDMRTTLVVLFLSINTGMVQWGHCGDSRLYHFNGPELVHRTRDHSVAQILLSDGEISESDIAHHPDRNRLTRCLGSASSNHKPRVAALEGGFSGNDVFLLCTDGWWEGLNDSKLLKYIENNGQKLRDPQWGREWLQSAAQEMASNLEASDDDSTALCVYSCSG